MTTEQTLTPQQVARDEYLAHIRALSEDQQDFILNIATKMFNLVNTTPGVLQAFVLVSAELAAQHSVDPHCLDEHENAVLALRPRIITPL